jgi:uncharacterized delta-60 repeat protein
MVAAVYDCTVIRLVSAVVVGMVALAATAVASASRPGSFENRIAAIAPGDDIQALGATPDGRILVAGRARYAGFTFIRAYRPDGTPDGGFGAGGEVNLGGGSDDVAALAVEPDGQIVIGQTAPVRLRRLNPDGGVDTSFGAGGSVDVDLGPGFVFFLTAALAPDGRIVVASVPQNSPAVQVRRYLPSGAPDPGFGATGHATVTPRDPPFYSSVAVQPDGGIVVAMDGANAGLRIARLFPDGSLDGAFGRGGVAPIELGRPGWREDVRAAAGLGWRPLALPDGRIQIPVTFGPREHVSRAGVVGLTQTGHVDRRYGRRGLALGPRRRVPQGGEWPRVAVLDSRGSVLLAGSSASADDLSGEDSTIVRRFRRDGTLDLSFGRRGLVRGTLGSTGGGFQQQLAMLDADTVVLAEEDTIPKYQSWNGGALSAFNAGHDGSGPIISVGAGCRAIRVRITDASALDRVVVRADGRVIRRTTRKRFRIRLPRGTRRVSVRAWDLAGNLGGRGSLVPRC